MQTQIQKFAELGKAFRQLQVQVEPEFADTDRSPVNDPEIVEEVRSLLEEEIGSLDQVTGLTIDDADVLRGRATQKVSLGKSQIYQFAISTGGIVYQMVNAADMAEFGESDEAWIAIVDYAAKAKSSRAGKKLNCKPGNMQCGGKCQKGDMKCSKSPTPEQKAKVEKVTAKAKSKKTVATAKTEEVKPAKAKATAQKQKDAESSTTATNAASQESSTSTNRQAGSHKIFDRSLVPEEGEIPTKDDLDAMSNQLVSKLGMQKKQATESVNAVLAFTEEGYTRIRSDERSGKNTPEIEAINRYINQAPKYDGDIYRGLSFKRQEDFENFLASASLGGEMKLDAMSSFSSDRKIAERFTRDNDPVASVVMKVNSNRSGVSIQDLTRYPDENEVLVPKGANYRIANIVRNGNRVEIELEDVAPPLEKSATPSEKPKTSIATPQSAIAKYKAGQPLTSEEKAILMKILGV